jgi:hypothetical protein
MKTRAYVITLIVFIAGIPYAHAGEAIYAPPPELLRFMREADRVFVFPNPTPRHPHRDDKHMRLLTSEARHELVRLLGRACNWYVGGDDRIGIGPLPKDIGLLFRRGSDELVLFFYPGELIDARFNGRRQPARWSPGGRSDERMGAWKAHYARPELSPK